MVTISDSTLRANVYETLYDLVYAISSWGLSSSATVTVTAAYIDGTDSDDGVPPLPQVVIHPIMVSNDPVNYDRSLMDREIRVLIEIFTKKKKDLDQIADKIMDTIESASTLGMMLVDTDENNAMNASQSKVHSKALSFTYKRRS
jgi:hypothetical protein